MKRVRWKIDFISFKCRHCQAPYEQPQDLIKHKKERHAEEIKRYPTVIHRRTKGCDSIPRHVKQLVLKATKKKIAKAPVHVFESTAKHDHSREPAKRPMQVSPATVKLESINSQMPVSPDPAREKPVKKRAKIQLELPSAMVDLKIVKEETEPVIAQTGENCNWYFRKRRLNCLRCYIKFPTTSDLIAHKKEKHPDPKFSVLKFACSQCNSHFTNELSFDTHVNLHRLKEEENTDFPCQTCTKRFLTPLTLQEHAKYYHYDESPGSAIPVVLASTNGETYHRKKLRQNLKLSSNKKGNYKKPYGRGSKFRCEFCPKRFKSGGGLFYHQSRQHKQHRFACTQCDHSYTLESRYQAHLKSAHGSASEASEYTSSPSKSTSVISVTSRRVKGVEPAQIIRSRIEERFHVCEYCRRRFASDHELRVHYALHKAFRPYKCRICSKGFPCRSHVYAHERKKHNFRGTYLQQIHLPSDLENIKGETLDTSTNETTQEEITVASEPDEAPVVSVTVKSELLEPNPEANEQNEEYVKIDETTIMNYVGIRFNNGKKVHYCKKCTKTFQKLSKLKPHVRSHIGSRPFGCNHCPSLFPSFSSLKLHSRRSHGRNVPNARKGLFAKKYLSAEGLAMVSYSSSAHLKAEENVEGVGDSISANPIKKNIHLPSEMLFPCNVCKRQLPSFEELVAHKKSAHPHLIRRVETFPCPLCHTVSTGKTAHNSHMYNHRKFQSENRDHPCTLCEKRFLSSAMLEKHKLSFHFPVSGKALQPEGGAAVSENMASRNIKKPKPKSSAPHRRIRAGLMEEDGQLKGVDVKNLSSSAMAMIRRCRICKISFTTTSQMIAHKIQEHARLKSIAGVFPCPHCHTVNTNRTNHRQHVKRHEIQKQSNADFPCEKCPRRFLTTAALMVHSSKYHHDGVAAVVSDPVDTKRSENLDVVNSATELDSNPTCELTPALSPRTHVTEENFKSIPGVIPSNSVSIRDSSISCNDFEIPNKPKWKPFVFYCKICHEKFPTAPCLLDHKKIKHPHLKSGLFQCSYCYTLNTDQRNYATHLNKHKAAIKTNTDFPCDRCDKRFLNAHGLKLHLKHEHTKTHVQSKSKSTSKRHIPRAVGTFPGFFSLPQASIIPGTTSNSNPSSQAIATG